MLTPKLWTTLRGYTRQQWAADTIAGIIVGVVALPLAIAFAIASGVSPERGLYTAIIAGFLISVLGGSRVQIGGPTGAFIVVVYGIVQQYGVEGLLLATMMAGMLLVALGLAGVGAAIKFIPYPLTVGFTSGIALIIFSTQIKDALGLPMGAVPAHVIEQWRAYAPHLLHLNGWAAALCAGSLGLMLFARRYFRRVPGPLIALLASTIVVQWFQLPVETIASRFGEIPHMLPRPSLPPFSLEALRLLSPAALTIAVLAGIEALLSAVVADGMIGGRHRSNMELVAQGVANLVTPLFGGIPATGAIARTATNVNSGGRTPVAGIVHALTLLVIMLCVGRWAGLIPLPCLAAILMLVAYNMSEWHSFRALLKSPRSDVVVLWTTFALTVLIDLTVAIQVGLLLAVLLFIRRIDQVTNVGMITRELAENGETPDPQGVETRAVPPGVEVYEIDGLLCFGASYKFREAMRDINQRKPKARIVRMRHVLAIDATGLQALKEQCLASRREGVAFVLAGVHAQPLVALTQSGLTALIGEENLCADLDEALARVRPLLKSGDTH